MPSRSATLMLGAFLEDTSHSTRGMPLKSDAVGVPFVPPHLPVARTVGLPQPDRHTGHMKPDALKAACLAMNGSVETFPFNAETSVFKVGGKMFALSALDATPLCVSLKCEPEVALQLRATHSSITGGWHLNKRHWNTVTLDGSLTERMVLEMIEDSYDLVVAKLPRAEQLLLDWPGIRRAEDR